MSLLKAKTAVIENFESLKLKLDQAEDLGFIDTEEAYYNAMDTLLEDAKMAQSWDELAAVIDQGKTLEEDLDTWLSLKGFTTIGLQWPTSSAE